jgi:hypothetical protein
MIRVRSLIIITSNELRQINTFSKQTQSLQSNAISLVRSNTVNYNIPFLEGFSPWPTLSYIYRLWMMRARSWIIFTSYEWRLILHVRQRESDFAVECNFFIGSRTVIINIHFYVALDLNQHCHTCRLWMMRARSWIMITSFELKPIYMFDKKSLIFQSNVILQFFLFDFFVGSNKINIIFLFIEG